MAVKQYMAFIGKQGAGEYFHQGAFACAVFTNKRVCFAAMNPQAYAVQCGGSAEFLADVLHFKAWNFYAWIFLLHVNPYFPNRFGDSI